MATCLWAQHLWLSCLQAATWTYHLSSSMLFLYLLLIFHPLPYFSICAVSYSHQDLFQSVIFTLSLAYNHHPAPPHCLLSLPIATHFTCPSSVPPLPCYSTLIMSPTCCLVSLFAATSLANPHVAFSRDLFLLLQIPSTGCFFYCSPCPISSTHCLASDPFTISLSPAASLICSHPF